MKYLMLKEGKVYYAPLPEEPRFKWMGTREKSVDYFWILYQKYTEESIRAMENPVLSNNQEKDFDLLMSQHERHQQSVNPEQYYQVDDLITEEAKTLAIDFSIWYSGMKRLQVQTAFERYLRER